MQLCVWIDVKYRKKFTLRLECVWIYIELLLTGFELILNWVEVTSKWIEKNLCWHWTQLILIAFALSFALGYQRIRITAAKSSITGRRSPVQISVRYTIPFKAAIYVIVTWTCIKSNILRSLLRRSFSLRPTYVSLSLF